LPSGAYIIACHGSSRHIVALEDNEDIFNAILKLMRKLIQVAIAPLPPLVFVVLED